MQGPIFIPFVLAQSDPIKQRTLNKMFVKIGTVAPCSSQFSFGNLPIHIGKIGQ
jgi:hypothetical protein